MSLALTGTWEHAILVATVKAADDVGANAYLGRTALQKIVYFLQIAGVPMKYTFDIYHFGPYCDRITRDVEWLLADEVLRDASQTTTKYSNYRIGAAADELLAQSEGVSAFIPTIRNVVQALLPLQPDHLELLATLDYVFRQLKAGGGAGPWRERVIAKFIAIKKDKFPRSQIDTAYDSLVNARLIEA